MAQRLKDDLREKIESAALDIMLEKGVDNLDMRSVAQKAGCTTGNIYRYYRNKERLLLAVLRPLTDRLSEIISRRTDGDITLMEDLSQIEPDTGDLSPVEYIRFLLQDSLYGVLIQLGEEARRRPKLMKVLIEAHSVGDRLIEWIIRTVGQIFYSCIRVDAVYEKYVNILIRVFTQSFCYGVTQLLMAGEKLDAKAYRGLTDRFMSMQLGGICMLLDEEIEKGTIKPRAEVFNG